MLQYPTRCLLQLAGSCMQAGRHVGKDLVHARQTNPGYTGFMPFMPFAAAMSMQLITCCDAPRVLHAPGTHLASPPSTPPTAFFSFTCAHAALIMYCDHAGSWAC